MFQRRNLRRSFIAGERAAPPEDCGGVPSFYGALEVLSDPKHPDIVDWFDGYDPDSIDELVLKIALRRIARRLNPAKATFGKKTKA